MSATRRLSASQTNSNRKKEQLEIVLNEDVQSKISTGLESYQFVHCALPEIDLDDVDLSTSLFGKKLAAPLVISSMVGGIDLAKSINQNLAKAAQTMGVAMGIGSQRSVIEDENNVSSYVIRDVAPDILLFANLGAIQLNNGYGVSECRRAVEMIEADALILHLNPLQEALQTDGNTNFGRLLKKIEQVCRELTVPVIAKEVGWGISEDAARKLASVGIAGIDVSGAGGTSWSEVERRRARSQKARSIGLNFASWGISTADSIQMARTGAPGVSLIASGGIRNGLDVAKSIALGADAAGMATPLLKTAVKSAESVIEILEEVTETLRICMFCTGISSIAELRNSTLLKKISR